MEDITLRRIISYFYIYFFKYELLTDVRNWFYASIYLSSLSG
jgi:hypothetical protein